MFKKQNFSIPLFIIASLAAFGLLGLFYFVSAFAYFLEPAPGQTFKNAPISDKYYLNKNYKNGDPLITRNPNLSDMLSGPIIGFSDPDMGNEQAAVVIVLFSDFTCDFCVQQEKALKKIMKRHKDKVRLVWKDYPETSLDSLSFQSARAARCADKQGKFWQYHDFLFANNEKLGKALFYQGARSLDLDIEAFEQCLAGNEVDRLIKDNILEANALDINGVPFVYINDQEIMGHAGMEELERIIKIEFNK